MQAPAAESAPQRRVLILLQFYTEKLLDSVYQLLMLKNSLLNGREAAV
jgi:hypothetical protein